MELFEQECRFFQLPPEFIESMKRSEGKNFSIISRRFLCGGYSRLSNSLCQGSFPLFPNLKKVLKMIPISASNVFSKYLLYRAQVVLGGIWPGAFIRGMKHCDRFLHHEVERLRGYETPTQTENTPNLLRAEEEITPMITSYLSHPEFFLGAIKYRYTGSFLEIS